MKYMNFAIRTVSLLLILGVLWQYQHIAASRAPWWRSGSSASTRWRPIMPR